MENLRRTKANCIGYSTFSKLYESYAVEWILNDTNDKISESQFGGLAECLLSLH